MKLIPIESARKFMLQALQTSYCIDYQDFCYVMHDSCKDYYTMGKFKAMQKDYLKWFCDLDKPHQSKWVAYITDKMEDSE